MTRVRNLVGWLLPLIALVLVVWSACARAQRIQFLSGLTVWSVETPAVDGRSPTGYAGQTRRLLVSDHGGASYQWIVQVGQMTERGAWRIRHVDYDNAPAGRASHLPAPYGWWCVAVASVDHWITGDPLGLAVERAALLADPVFHVLFLMGTWLFVGWRFGKAPALISVGLAAMYPWAAAFIPGTPDQYGPAQACAVWSLLLLLAGMRAEGAFRQVDDPRGRNEGASRLWFFLSGTMGGIGLWLNLATQVALVVGIVVGGLLAARAVGSVARLPWRVWSLTGAATVLVGYAVEYLPSNLSWHLEVIHPAYALGWLGAGELLLQGSRVLAKEPGSPWQRHLLGGAGILGIAIAPVIIWLTAGQGILVNDPLVPVQAVSSIGGATKTIFGWLVRDSAAWIALAPLLAVGPALRLLGHRDTPVPHRAMLMFSLGVVATMGSLGLVHLRWWNVLESAIFALVVAIGTTAAGSVLKPGRRMAWLGGLAVIAVTGGFKLFPDAQARRLELSSAAEVRALVERDLAHWLAQHSTPGRATVLAPPQLTAALCFYANARGLGTFYWENRPGIAAAIRIAGSTNPEELSALIQEKEITHIVLPSWDTGLEDYMPFDLGPDSGSGPGPRAFITDLRAMVLPSWLQPVPYHVPSMPGFEEYSVRVFTVVEETDEAVAASRLTDYFIEMGERVAADKMRALLQPHSADLVALVALAQLEQSSGNEAAFTLVLNRIVPFLARGPARGLPFDRRVALASMLAHGQRLDLCQVELKRCLTELDATRLRSLSPKSLILFQRMCRTMRLEIPDPNLRELAVELVPPSLRERL